MHKRGCYCFDCKKENEAAIKVAYSFILGAVFVSIFVAAFLAYH